jgi:hypothetical protein
VSSTDARSAAHDALAPRGSGPSADSVDSDEASLITSPRNDNDTTTDDVKKLDDIAL